MGRKLPEERKGGLETYEVREGHRGKKTAGRKKTKFENLRSMRRPPGWDRSLPEKRKSND